MPSRLRPQQLEARVIELVDLVLAGQRIEDDLVECKGQWPDPQQRSSARQLAGLANKAHDDAILWIVGLDEKAHVLTQPGPVEVADWWAAVSSRFDPPAPDLEHDLVVPVGERQAVTALRFLTEMSPYVIRVGDEGGPVDREVPIRDGTRTRSARRDELLRLLIPAVAPPSAQLLSARVYPGYYPSAGKGLGQTLLHLEATVFFQQPAMSTGVVMLPAHLMHGRIDSDGGIGSLRCKLSYSTSPDGLPPPQSAHGRPQAVRTVIPATPPLHGVERRKDGLYITGPGTPTVTGGVLLDGDLRAALAAASAIRIHLSFGVAGIDRRIKLDAGLDCFPDEDSAHQVEWRLSVPADDPWAETDNALQ
jgi:hypothetical protein